MAESNTGVLAEMKLKINQYEAKIAQQHTMIQRLIKDNLLLKDKIVNEPKYSPI